MKYITFETNAGWVGILASAKGLLGATLPQSSAQKARHLLGNLANQAILSPERFADLMIRFQEYYRGQKVAFPDELDLSAATSFQRRVWETTRLIPHGETRSYHWVANQIERPSAARAVGQALGKNPLLIIVPCHRVIASDGTLGGFTGGLEMKGYLLRLEAAVIR